MRDIIQTNEYKSTVTKWYLNIEIELDLTDRLWSLSTSQGIQ